MRRFMRIAGIMSIGAFFYGGTELAGRGRTHISMGLLGGLAFGMIHLLNDERRRHRLGLLTMLLISTFFITSCELLTGEILNVRLGLDIWSYEDIPMNFDGQVCPMFSVFWFILSLIGVYADELARRLIFNEGGTGYDGQRKSREGGVPEAQRS